MLFNSISFALFLPVAFILYWFVFQKRLNLQNLFLLVASYIFYGWWSWKFIGLLALSTILDYLYGFGVASGNRNKAKLFLRLSVVNNLGILALYKYYNFFVKEITSAVNMLGLEVSPLLISVVLPVGISFYTFHGMSYVFDIYRGHQKPISSIVDYAVFVSFFPLLVAGPIERAHHLLPQVMRPRIFQLGNGIEGCKLIVLGFFKKIVIADSIAPLVNSAFESPHSFSSFSLFISAVGFSFQIYADFSGYSDIASGTAKLFGFELLKNFNLPYFSRSIPEFWKRWHISLSSWFRDYLYIPLGGSKAGFAKSIRNVFIIFLVSGFWHGANWTFICWGSIHAALFLPSFLLKRNRKYFDKNSLVKFSDLPKIIFVFLMVTLAWVFFRAETIHDALCFFEQMSMLTCSLDLMKTMTHWILLLKSIVGILVLFSIEWLYFRKGLALPGKLIIVLSIFLIFFGSYRNAVSFIYFQF